MRNEGPHCLEWIAHHLAAGVGHFLVYTNDCDDGTDRIMDVLQQTGIVTHFRTKQKGKSPIQWQSLKHAWELPRLKNADWVLISDCDEFINLRAPLNSLADLVEALPDDTDAVAMSWRLFGNSGQIEMRDMLTTDRFSMAAPENISLPLAHFFKSLFRPRAFRQPGVHRPKRRKDTVPVWVDGSGNRLPDGFAKQDGRINLFGLPHGSDLVQLNHYSLRSAESFLIKRSRGLPNHTEREIGLGYWAERNFNTQKDTSIERMSVETQRKLDELRLIPELDALHKAAFAAHQEKFNKMMENRDNIQLFWHLALCANSQPPDNNLARTQINRIIKAQHTEK
ncbi:MAG TPA: glycosyltransferase family 2 protein [Rhodobacteraceae bacterium]|nr:glycosyltransferase family 2 protein [Paracoccaceae bacterium]